MTEEELNQRVEAETARVTAIARTSIRNWYAHSEEAGRTNLRFDTFMVLGIPVWDQEEDGGAVHEREDVMIMCESKKHHVKRGILANANDRTSIR